MEESKPENKKAKLETAAIDKNVYSKILQTFRLVGVLSEDAYQKSIYVHGKVVVDSQLGEEDVVLILERTPLKESLVHEIASESTDFTVLFSNDVYSSLQLYPKVSAGAMKSTVIYPATPKHIAKYQNHQILLMRETPQDYQQITLPHITSSKFSLQWLYNVLEGKTEADRVVLKDEDAQNGFVLLEDLKWDAKQTTNLYLVAICMRRDLLSIRSLRGCHVPILEQIRDRCKVAIKDKYNFDPRQLRIYFHYQPSYYHLHIHFANVSYESTSCTLGKAHLLDDVIDHLKEDSDYYSKVSLTFSLKENDPLSEKFVQAGRL